MHQVNSTEEGKKAWDQTQLHTSPNTDKNLYHATIKDFMNSLEVKERSEADEPDGEHCVHALSGS